MENLNFLDIVVIFLIFMLGLKGYINGFIKELFNFIGIVGGIYLASRFSYDMGDIINASVYKFDTEAGKNFVGFVVCIAIFWVFSVGLRVVLEKFVDLSNLDFVNKLLGIIVSGGKVFCIFAIIVNALSSIEVVNKNLKEFTNNSFMYPILKKSGENILKFDFSQIKQKANLTDAIEQPISDTLNSIKDTVIDEANKAK